MDSTCCWIEEFGPLPVCHPSSVEEIGELIREAAEKNQAVYPIGGQTQLGWGFPPARSGIVLDLRSLNQVIDYPARDMTITVQAGLTVARLQEILASEKQRLPIDVPFSERATLGGALATNASGPHRYGFGTLRDYVIGIQAVNDQGQSWKAGGRVVKNVAGYDLCKLLIGSLGTLGVMTQVTLKLRPRAESVALVLLVTADNGLEALVDRLHATQTRPVSLTLLNPKAAWRLHEDIPACAGGMPAPQASAGTPAPQVQTTGWYLIVGYEGKEEAVDWQVRQLQEELPVDVEQVVSRQESATDRLWQKLADFPLSGGGSLTFKANVLPRLAVDFCRKAVKLEEVELVQAEIGNGIIVGHTRADLSLERARPLVRILQDSATMVEGNMILARCPPAWKSQLPVWGKPRGDWWLMRRLKEQLDPNRRFNPGRFIEGI